MAPAPTIEQVRTYLQWQVSGTDPGRPLPLVRQVAPVAERHYYRTGRDTQFNTKIRAETAAFIAIATEDGVPSLANSGGMDSR